jgi:hypothetical protein
MHLEIDRISSCESVRRLSDGIVGMAIEDIKVGDPLLVEERTSHATMESFVRISAGGIRSFYNTCSRTSTYHLNRQFEQAVVAQFPETHHPS